MIKRICALALCLALLLTATNQVLANGDPNMENGGGEMGSGNYTNGWLKGWDGIRVTVVRAADNASVTIPVDFTNLSVSADTRNFGRVSKISYKNGASLSPRSGNYASVKPANAIPRIIPSQSVPVSIQTIKAWWCTENAAKMVAENTGMTYDQLISGEYVMMLEPIAYLYYGGNLYAMTATEAGMMIQQDRSFYNWLRSVVAQNLPFSLFLERNDIGFSAYSGQSSTYLAYENTGIIKTQLGIGTVRYSDTQTHTVTFHRNYSGAGVYTTRTVEDNAKVSAPTAPTRTDYSFDGWYTTPQGLTKYDFSKPVTADLTLYAKWRFTPPPDSTDGYTIIWTEQTSHGNCHHYYTYKITLTPTLTLTPSALKSGYGFEVLGKGTMSSVTQIGYGGDCEYRSTTKANSITPAWPTSIKLNTGWTVQMKMANGSTKTQPDSITLDPISTGSNLRTWQAPKNPISETLKRKVYTDVSLAGTVSSPRQHPVVLKMTGGGIPSRNLFFNASKTQHITINGVMYEDDYTGAN